MIGLDANILLRLIVQDNPEQLIVAKKFLAQNCTQEEPGYINLVALLEIFLVLRRFYRYPPERLADSIEALLNTRVFLVERNAMVAGALELYRSQKSDFSDALIGLINRDCGVDYTITFDREAAKLPGFKLLKA